MFDDRKAIRARVCAEGHPTKGFKLTPMGRAGPPSASPVYRCDGCGNKTRFDVFETKSVRAFQHFTLAGEMSVEEEEVLTRTVERVVCRWCGRSEGVVEVEPRTIPDDPRP